MAELKSLLWTLFLTLAVDFLTIAVLLQNKAVARDQKSPYCEIQTGLHCEYDGLSEVVLSFTHSIVTNCQIFSEIICTSINSAQYSNENFCNCNYHKSKKKIDLF